MPSLPLPPPPDDSTRRNERDVWAGFAPNCDTCLRPLRPVEGRQRHWWRCDGCALEHIG